jgi:hypothetical protein
MRAPIILAPTGSQVYLADEWHTVRSVGECAAYRSHGSMCTVYGLTDGSAHVDLRTEVPIRHPVCPPTESATR